MDATGTTAAALPAADAPPAKAPRATHPLLIWEPDSAQGWMGLRGHAVFIRVAWTGAGYRVVPTFPLPRGSRVTDAAALTLAEAQAKAEFFFASWLKIVGLHPNSRLRLPARR